VWDPIGATLSNRIQTLQNRAARVILGYRNEQGQSEAALSELGWKTLKERRLIMKARLMYKITHSQAPVNVYIISVCYVALFMYLLNLHALLGNQHLLKE
jgi:hypothetical protein